MGSVEQDERGYQSANLNSSAVGKYQHLWNLHKDQIAKVTGVTNIQDYLNNPEAQEKYQTHLESQYKRNVPGLRKRFPEVTKGIDDEVLMALQHFSGLGDARVYLDTLEKTKSYEAAQESLNQSIKNRTGQAPPPNRTVFEYLNNFSENLERQKDSEQPQVTAPETQPQVNPNKVNLKEESTKVTTGAKPVKSTLSSNAVTTKFKEERPSFTLPSVEIDFNWRTSAKAVKWIYEAFGGSDEDKKNVLQYLENGGTLSDVWDMYENYKAKKGGSENSDLIGQSESIINTSRTPNYIISDWATPDFNKKVEPNIKSNYIVPKLKVSETPSVDKDNYTTRSFIANLKNSDNKFTILDNLHAGSGINNLNSYYNNFKPVKGSIVFTMQNDVVSGEKPLTTITKNDKWYEGSEYLIKLNNDKLEVVKTSSIKEGDKVFKLKNKIFSFEDFDIKDGNINTKYDSNINALVPTIKNDAKTYKSGNNLVIGLTDKKSSGYIPIENATQYGKSRGGSFIIFSEDLTQQYMIGGSFKNLYDFYKDLKNKYPNTDFKVFASDTGSYSNSIFPKSGEIDGSVYRKSNNRNTWGQVQHVVLTN